jgi:O-acetyl-ADP-ribose deacetylase (regulator of RNase III)
LAGRHGLRSIAFPSISTGAYRFPIERASRIAVSEIEQFLQANAGFEKVVVVCFGQDVYTRYQEIIAERGTDAGR